MNNTVKLGNKSSEIFPLNWDTDYFGIKSAKVILKDIVSEAEQCEIINRCNEFDFVTITNLNNHNKNNIWIGEKTDAFLTDLNIQFIKHVNNGLNSFDQYTYTNNSFPRNEKILKIAQNAFTTSRFYNDPYLPKEQAKNIYVHWTECAFNKAEKYFIVTEKQSEIVGYLLFSINFKSCFAIIELIAVDDAFRGQNIGKTLIAGIEDFIYKKGIRSIKVGTQVDNVSAIRFYNACGFQYVSCNSIYHYWPNRQIGLAKALR